MSYSFLYACSTNSICFIMIFSTNVVCRANVCYRHIHVMRLVFTVSYTYCSCWTTPYATFTFNTFFGLLLFTSLHKCRLLIFSRYLELESNGKWNEILLHYIHDNQIHIETFPFRLANNHWHKLALTLSVNHVTLYINCSKVFERPIQPVDRQYLSGSKLNLYIGQRSQRSTYFMVSRHFPTTTGTSTRVTEYRVL